MAVECDDASNRDELFDPAVRQWGLLLEKHAQSQYARTAGERESRFCFFTLLPFVDVTALAPT